MGWLSKFMPFGRRKRFSRSEPQLHRLEISGPISPPLKPAPSLPSVKNSHSGRSGWIRQTLRRKKDDDEPQENAEITNQLLDSMVDKERHGNSIRQQRPTPSAQGPCWIFSNRSYHHISILPEHLPELFGKTSDEIQGIQSAFDHTGDPLFAPALQAILVEILGPRFLYEKRCKGASSPISLDIPIYFSGTCLTRRVRIGIFDAPIAFPEEFLGEQYFVPYLILWPKTFTRAESLSLPDALSAATYANLRWDRSYSILGNVSFYAAAMLSESGPTPDFTTAGAQVIDSPYRFCSFLPGILVVLPQQQELCIPTMQNAVVVAREAIESCIMLPEGAV